MIATYFRSADIREVLIFELKNPAKNIILSATYHRNW